MAIKQKAISLAKKIVYSDAMQVIMKKSSNVLITQKMIEAVYTPHAVQSLATLSKVYRSYANVMCDDANISRFLELVCPYVSPSLNLVRIGAHRDGGYLMLPPPPPLIDPKSKPIAVSLGISDYSPWDLQMADLGYQVLEFDASIDKSPYPKHPNIKFFKKFAGVVDSENTMSFERIISESKMNPNVHNILQCDIENAEWDILDKLDISLLAKNFAQVLFEFHDCDPSDEQKSAYRFKILEKLNEFYAPVHIHFNVGGRLHIAPNSKISESSIAPQALLWNEVPEVSYVRKDLLPANCQRAKGVYTHSLDRSNSPFFPEQIVVF